MITIPSLWTHQAEQVNAVAKTLGQHDAAILCARAGGGKTRMAKYMIGRNLSRPPADGRSGRCLFAVYGRNLVDNASGSFNEEPALPHGLIMSGAETDWQKQVHIGSVDTLISWYVQEGVWSAKLSWDLIIYDECMSGDSIIETDIGAIRIDDAKTLGAKLVKSFDAKSDSVVMKPIVDWKMKGIKKTLTIHTKNGSFRCTGDHKIYTERGWLQANDVTKSDSILVSADATDDQDWAMPHAGGTRKTPPLKATVNYGLTSKKTPQCVYADAANAYHLSTQILRRGSNSSATQCTEIMLTDTSTARQTNHLRLPQLNDRPYLGHCLVTVQSDTRTEEVTTHAFPAHMALFKRSGQNTKQPYCTGLGQKLELQRMMAGGSCQSAQSRPVFHPFVKFTKSHTRTERSESLRNGWIQSVTSDSHGGFRTMEADLDTPCSCTPKALRIAKTNLLRTGSAITSERQPSLGIKQRDCLSLTSQVGHKSNLQISSCPTPPSACSTSWSRVTKIDPGEVEAVYDIEVEDTHCFFANGHLVHNCHAHLPKFKRFREAHDAYRKASGLRPCKCVGLSATPDHKIQSEVFGAIVNGPSTEWLIEQGKLAPFEYFHATQGRMGQLIKKGSEYTEESISNAMDGLTGDLVRDWKQFGQGRPTVGFFPRLAHAMEAKELLCESGIVAEYVDGATPDSRRRDLFKWLASGDIEYLCNVGVVERGTNIPEISCIQLATIIRKRSRLEQMLGRGSRTSPESGKTNCRVIDHGCNIHGKPDSLGFFEDEIEWTLDASNSKDKNEEGERPTIKCPQCSRVYRGGKCSACGYEPKPKELKQQGLEFQAGEMVRLDRDKIKPKKEAGKKSMESLMISALYAAGSRNGTWGQAWAIAAAKAKKQGDKFKAPASFQVAGQTYKPVPYGSADSKRRVGDLYDFIGRKHS